MRSRMRRSAFAWVRSARSTAWIRSFKLHAKKKQKTTRGLSGATTEIFKEGWPLLAQDARRVDFGMKLKQRAFHLEVRHLRGADSRSRDIRRRSVTQVFAEATWRVNAARGAAAARHADVNNGGLANALAMVGASGAAEAAAPQMKTAEAPSEEECKIRRYVPELEIHRAIGSYASFYELDPAHVKLQDLIRSCAGFHGWAEANLEDFLAVTLERVALFSAESEVECRSLSGDVLATLSGEYSLMEFRQKLADEIGWSHWQINLLTQNGELLSEPRPGDPEEESVASVLDLLISGTAEQSNEQNSSAEQPPSVRSAASSSSGTSAGATINQSTVARYEFRPEEARESSISTVAVAGTLAASSPPVTAPPQTSPLRTAAVTGTLPASSPPAKPPPQERPFWAIPRNVRPPLIPPLQQTMPPPLLE